MKEICPAGAPTKIYVGRTTRHFGYHGQASQQARQSITCTNSNQIFIWIGHSLPRIKPINRLYRKQRFETINKKEHENIFPENRTANGREVSIIANAGPEVTDLHQIKSRFCMFKIHDHRHWNGYYHYDHRCRNGFKNFTLQQGHSKNNNQTDNTYQHHTRLFIGY